MNRLHQEIEEYIHRGTNTCMLDAAGASITPKSTHIAVINYITQERLLGGYEALAENIQYLDVIRRMACRTIGVSPENFSSIALMANATHAWNAIFYALHLRPGDRILVSQVEYVSTALAALQRKQREGVIVDIIPCHPSGHIDVEALDNFIDERVKIVSLTHMPTHSGLVNDPGPIIETCHKVGACVILDACQSCGQTVFAPNAYNADAVTVTGRKWLRGPRGTGFLFLKPELLEDVEPSQVSMAGTHWSDISSYTHAPSASKFEFWENSYANIFGLGKSLEVALEIGVDVIENRIQGLAHNLRTQLAQREYLQIQDCGEKLSGIVTVTSQEFLPAELALSLKESGIIVKHSIPEGALIDCQRRTLPYGVLRISPHYYNTQEEIDLVIRELDKKHGYC